MKKMQGCATNLTCYIVHSRLQTAIAARCLVQLHLMLLKSQQQHTVCNKEWLLRRGQHCRTEMCCMRTQAVRLLKC